MKVALYARYSTDKQDARSIDDQLRRCRELSDGRKWEVVGVFIDEATSGAHTMRAGLTDLLRLAKKRGAMQGVVVDDQSRLARDLGSSINLIFNELPSLGVKLIDCSTGRASDEAGSRALFAVNAIVTDQFLEMVRHETHRGMEGRAIAGLSTGGRTYGYKTIATRNPADPERPLMEIVIDEAEAATVRRIFGLYAEKCSLKRLAAMLNDEGVAAPHDSGNGNKIGLGWPHTTVRAILLNDSYLGKRTWNRSKWVRVPGQKSRRRVERPQSEWKIVDAPHLRIIDDALWNAVHAKLHRRNAAGGNGRPAGEGVTGSLLSGLLRCGVCGGSMTLVCSKMKAGKRYPNFGCTSHSQRGRAICSNGMLISERKATAGILGALRSELLAPGLVQRFVDTFKRTLATLEKEAEAGSDTADRLRESDRRVRNLTEAIARSGWSDSLGDMLRTEEDRRANLRAQIAQETRQADRPTTIPHPTLIESYLRDLLGGLHLDVHAGREVLARHMTPVVMTPHEADGERWYMAAGAFNIALTLGLSPPTDSGGEVLGKKGSGGPHDRFPRTMIPVQARVMLGRGR
jgi:DNA invertase Pin-like site-specific DNA recombinase